MSRDYAAPFDFLESEPVGRALDCLGPRQAAGPFHYLINEQAKSLLALQELQHEVGALLEFRDLVIETFPSLRTKLSSSSSSSAAPTSHGGGGTVLARTDWVPGVRVRRKLGAKKNDAVPDSGFITETSSKDTHSATSSTAMATTSASTNDETDDELWSLLDVIHRKGTRLRDEVEALQGQLQQRSPPEEEFQRSLFRASVDDVRQIRRERDSLMGRLAEMEAEVMASRIHTSRLQEDLEQLLIAKQDLEEQLREVVDQRGEVNSRIQDLHSQFVTKSGGAGAGVVATTSDSEKTRLSRLAASKTPIATSQRDIRTSGGSSGGSETDAVLSSSLDRILGDEIPKVKVTDSTKFSAILSERNPLVLQKHLLSSTVRNDNLLRQLESASRLEVNLVDKLDKFREENEELRFQLEDKKIELEGTRARVRMLELLQQRTPASHAGPDVIPTSTLGSSLTPSRSEILSSSMKNMSPILMNTLQVDHSSSTESAHDQSETNRKNAESARRKPSKIPLKSYTAPKPPGRGKSHQGARSRSGDSPGRPHSAQSARGSVGAKSEANSLQVGCNNNNNNNNSKSRNASLVTSKDSLSSKLRSSDSLPKLSSASSNSFGSSMNRSTLRKNSSPVVKWTSPGSSSSSASAQGKELQPTDKGNLNPASRETFQYQWNPCSFEQQDSAFPDSLDRTLSDKFQTANTFTWNKPKGYYDSIDSNLFSSLYQQNGEQLADCDSLESHVSIVSDQ